MGHPAYEMARFSRVVGRVPSPGDVQSSHNENCWDAQKRACALPRLVEHYLTLD
jgi:hypothetical protein